MKIIYPWIWLLLACVSTAFSKPVPYTGKISLDGINFEGQANFRFTIYTQDGKAVWRNGKDAKSTISVSVKQGRYSVLLGGQGMDPISPELFLENETLYLSVYVDLNDGKGLRHLPPDQPYFRPSCSGEDLAERAKRAQVAESVDDGAISKLMLRDSLQREIDAPISASRFDPALIAYLAPILAPVSTSEISDLYRLKNTEATLLGPEADGRNLSYQWYRNGQKLEGATAKDLELYDLSIVRDEGTYEVVVANDFGEFRQTLQLDVFEIGASAIEAGHNHSLYIDQDGYLHGFGKNSSGQLGGRRITTLLRNSFLINL